MKKRIFLGCMYICIFLYACGRSEKISKKTLSEAWVQYDTEGVAAYSLDENGNLYTFERSGDILEEMSTFCLRKYDIEGERKLSKVLPDVYSSYTTTMAVKDGIVFFAPSMFFKGVTCAILHSYNPETGEIVSVKEFPYFKRVNRIIAEGDLIFLLGTNVDYTGGVDSTKYVNSGERIMCYTISTGEVRELRVEEPIDIGLSSQGHLCLYMHTDEGYIFSIYDVMHDVMKTIAKSDTYKMCNMALCNKDQGILYQTDSRGLVYSSLEDLDVESELYPHGYFWDNNLCYVNGRVACITKEGRVIQFVLDDVKSESKRIRYIATGNELVEPFGCGFEMQRKKLEEDKFALKVMALDRDFDICFVNSAYSFSYNLKMNGVFYPLNEVPGIQEYFEKCFPYVREAATDEDGNIWMLPIAVNIPGIVYSEGEKGLLDNDITYEQYCKKYFSLTSEEKTKSGAPHSFIGDFVKQYIMNYHSINTEQFCDVLRLMATSFIEGKKSDGSDTYHYVPYEELYYTDYVKRMGENAKVYELPKVSEEYKNAGTCFFIAVNPYSKNLEASLDYISSLISYMEEKEREPLFFSERVVEDTLLEQSLYELYSDGEIVFLPDEEIYEGYIEVMQDISMLDEYISETDRKLKIYLNE